MFFSQNLQQITLFFDIFIQIIMWSLQLKNFPIRCALIRFQYNRVIINPVTDVNVSEKNDVDNSSEFDQELKKIPWQQKLQKLFCYRLIQAVSTVSIAHKYQWLCLLFLTEVLKNCIVRFQYCIIPNL